MVDKIRCAKRVYHSGGIWGGSLCAKEGKYLDEEDGKHYCKIHSKEGESARQQKREERWAKEQKAWELKYSRDRYDGLAGVYCQLMGLSREYLEDEIKRLKTIPEP